MQTRTMAVISAVVMLSGPAGTAAAGPLEDGRAAERSHNVAEAARIYGLAAAQGDREAEYRLAGLYATGKVPGKAAADAVAWYRRAADQGQAEAQFTLGGILADGELGVPVDLVEAYKWVSLASTHLGPDQAFKIKLATGALGVLASRMSAADLSAAKAQVAAWVQR